MRRRRRERQQDAREGRRDATLRHNEANACYPGSIVILGDSRGTGDDSDPNRPNTDVPANDWATGTNPAVDSVYLRLLARDPAIKGHNYNLVQDGTNVDVLADKQAPSAVKLTPAPQLFLISTGGNDRTTCPAHAADVKAYGAALAKALSVLASGAPQSHTFIVSLWGSLVLRPGSGLAPRGDTGGCLARTQDPTCSSATRGSENKARRRQGRLEWLGISETEH